MQSTQAMTKTIFSRVMQFVWSNSPTIPPTPPNSRGRVLLGIMDPGLKTFTITMPSVGVFLFGTALCCFCCFKYGLQRWYEKTIINTRTKSRAGITYAESLQYKKDQLESALHKITKLRKVEPNRSDLKYESVALKEGIRMLNEHIRNSERYADYCEGMKRPSLEGMYSKRDVRVPFDTVQESAFVNPMFSSQQAINSGYMIDPVKMKNGPAGEEPQLGVYGSPSSSDEECHNPKHKELELYLMSTGGAIRPFLLRYPESATITPKVGFPGGSRGTPLGRQEIDSEGRSLNMMSPRQQDLQREMGSPIEQAASPNRAQNIPTPMNAARYVQPRPGMSQTSQPNPQDMQNFGSISSPSSPNFSSGGPNLSPGGPNFGPGPIQGSGNNTYGGSQPRVSP